MTSPYEPARTTGTANDWAAYTDAALKIASVRHDEAQQARRRASAIHDGEAELDRLRRRLVAQRLHLLELAGVLRLPVPDLDGVARSPIPDPAEAIRRASMAADRAERATRVAERAAARPSLLPDTAPPVRNGIVYASAALVGSIASALLFFASPDTDLGRIPWQLVPWSMCGLPAIAFFGGYLVIMLLGQPRVGEAGTRSVRLGGAICFIGMPILWFIFIAATRG